MQKNASTGPASRTRELLEILLRNLPEDASLLRTRREEVLAATRAFDPARDPLAEALDVCLRSLRQRVRSLQETGEEPPGAPLPPETPHAREVVQGAPQAASPVPTRQILRWGPREKALYHDVVNLFDLGDQTGAMISLERLAMLAPKAEELLLFVQKNEALLLQTYQEALGSLQRKVFRIRQEHAIRIPTDHPEEMDRLLKFCDGNRRIEDLTRVMEQPPLVTLVMVSHLVRCRHLELG